MPTRLPSLRVLATLAVVGASGIAAMALRNARTGFEVHEWGTFTTVAGEDGKSIEWLTLGGAIDLPCFVEHYQGAIGPTLLLKSAFVKIDPIDPNNQAANAAVRIVPVAPVPVPSLDYQTARSQLWSKVRMETPVIYFYTPSEIQASVAVQFPQGLLTEWYPSAVSFQPAVTTAALRSPSYVGRLTWDNITIKPGPDPVYPRERVDSHYYPARETDASPIRVGNQHEKFLFYRGVGNFEVPVAAAFGIGGAVNIRNVGGATLSQIMLFENTGGVMRFTLHSGNVAPGAAITLRTGKSGQSFNQLRDSLQRVLVGAGLFPKEAAAMIETWRTSWFEEGTRVIYLMPERTVDAVLPLRVTPAPEGMARVFVGRMEILQPAVVATVEKALERGDLLTLAKYGRFLDPIVNQIITHTKDAKQVARIDSLATVVFREHINRVQICQ